MPLTIPLNVQIFFKIGLKLFHNFTECQTLVITYNFNRHKVFTTKFNTPHLATKGKNVGSYAIFLSLLTQA